MVYPASLSTSEAELRKEPWSLIAQSLAFTYLSSPLTVLRLLSTFNSLEQEISPLVHWEINL